MSRFSMSLAWAHWSAKINSSKLFFYPIPLPIYLLVERHLPLLYWSCKLQVKCFFNYYYFTTDVLILPQLQNTSVKEHQVPNSNFYRTVISAVCVCRLVRSVIFIPFARLLPVSRPPLKSYWMPQPCPKQLFGAFQQHDSTKHGVNQI